MNDTKNEANQSLVEPLSERELEVLQFIADGLSNREIAQRLYLALSTIKWHIKQIYSKLQAQNRSDAISIATELELVDNQTNITKTPAHNLPPQTSSLTGREQELLELGKLLTDPEISLISILGIGGIGKTRLAIELAMNYLSNFKDGAFFVSLAPISSPELIPSHIADALGFDFYQGTDPQKQLVDYFHEKQLLLVLDNFEHLLVAANLIDEILANAPQVKIVVTSRERLNLYSETIYALEGIAYPSIEQTHPLEEVTDYAAIRLFEQVAQHVSPEFKLNNDNIEAVVRICEYLQGMPLAIEMAASWVRMLSVTEIETEITQSLDFLLTKRRDISQRHRTMRAIFDQSWQLLNSDEQKGFRALSVFRGGFQREAIEQVTDASLISIISLVDKSLLYRDRTGRYQIHELLRQYAAEKLSETSEYAEKVLNSYCDYYAVFVSERLQQLKGGEQDIALYELSEEMANIRLGLQHALDYRRIENLEKYLRDLYLFFFMRSQFRDGLDLFSMLVSQIAEWAEIKHEIQLEYKQVYALALAYQGFFYVWMSDYLGSKESLNKSLTILNEINEQRDMTSILSIFGHTTYGSGDYPQAEQYFLQALKLCAEFDDEWLKSRILDGLGKIAYHRGEYEKSEKILQEAQHISQKFDDRFYLSVVLNDLSRVSFALKHYQEAKQMLHNMLDIHHDFGSQFIVAYAYGTLGMIEFQQGHLSEAYETIHKGLTILSDIGERVILARAQWQLGKIATALANYEIARQHFHTALSLTKNKQAIDFDVLNTILAIATLFASQGKLERALQLTMMVYQQTEISRNIQSEAQDLLDKLKSELAPEMVASIQNDAKTSKLENVIKTLAAEMES